MALQNDQFGQTQKHHVDSVTTLAQTVFANKRMWRQWSFVSIAQDRNLLQARRLG